MNEIKKDLNEFINSKFPNSNNFDITFLDIINSQEKENILSKIYAFYLDTNLSPIISNWFIDSLIELIEVNTNKRVDLINFDVYTEFSTLDKKGRIDILIKSELKKTVIIIENKVNHKLYNDLHNYWQTFDDSTYFNKIGIVLALKKTPINNNNFFLITHNEWAHRIEEKIKPEEISERQKIQLEDFLINLKYISYIYIMNENIKFYTENSSKIDELIKFRDEAYSFLNNKIYSVAEHYNWKIHGNSNEYKQIWNEINNERVFYTIFPNDILKRNELKIVIEIDGEALEYYNEIIDYLVKSNLNNYGLIKSDLLKNKFGHIGYVFFESISDNDMSNFDMFLIEQIEKLEPLRKDIFEKLIELGFK